MRDGKFAIGIDLGGTNIKYGICDAEGRIIKEFITSTPAEADSQVLLEKLVAVCREALSVAKQRNIAIQTVGMGTPGSVDVRTGFLKGNTPNLPFWKDLPIKEYLEERFSLPVFVDNDANVMAFGEYRFGAGKGYRDVVSITLGTGIGGGVIIGGELFRGSQYAGAELGHMSICFEGKRCRCGGIGCWEAYASATAMMENYNGRCSENRRVSDARQIFERYREQEALAIQIVELEARMVGVGLANLINIFNPEIMVIGGGVSEAGEWFIEMIRKEAHSRALQVSAEGVRIERATLGNKAGWLGAAACALQKLETDISMPLK